MSETRKALLEELRTEMRRSRARVDEMGEAVDELGSVVCLVNELEEVSQKRRMGLALAAGRAAPEGWDAIAAAQRVQPPKVRVSLRLDEDLAGWFRAQGRGHQTRMNAVLRAYMLSKTSGVV
jgi:uncharacterized protein (DUF4415 family)